jgi:hypothetical protein
MTRNDTLAQNGEHNYSAPEPGNTCGPRQGGRASRSVTVDVVLVSLLLVLFMAGTVFVFEQRIGGGGAVTVDRRLADEAERVLSHLGLMAEDAPLVRLLDPGPGEAKDADTGLPALEVLADLDGDPATGGFAAQSEEGLERVVIYRSTPGGRELIARVYLDPDTPAEEVILTSMLDPYDPEAFTVEFIDTGGSGEVTVGAVEEARLEITLKITSNGETGTFTRTFNTRAK